MGHREDRASRNDDMKYRVSRLINTSADDCRTSLLFVKDMEVLKAALTISQDMGHKMRTKYIERRIKQIGEVA